MNEWCGEPSGKVAPGSVDLIGQLGSIPAATLSFDP
jgi:hypothetical protein